MDPGDRFTDLLDCGCAYEQGSWSYCQQHRPGLSPLPVAGETWREHVANGVCMLELCGTVVGDSRGRSRVVFTAADFDAIVARFRNALAPEAR